MKRTAQEMAEFERIHENCIVQTIKKTQTIYRNALKELEEYHRRARKKRDRDHDRSAYWMRVSVLDMAGYYQDAEELLAEQLKRFPDVRSKNAAAAFLMHHSRHEEALRFLQRRVPGGKTYDDAETLWRRGYCELALGLKTSASRTMRRLAKLAEDHKGDIGYFHDLHFVSGMLSSGLALGDCRRYLDAILLCDKAPHDSREIKRLLRRLVKTPA